MAEKGNNKMKRFSFIVPVYNVEKYIPQCIESILSQSFSDFEILLIDDGSTDNSGNICDEYAKKDNRITVLHGINKGLSEARNKGIDVAKGDYIIFLDSDDYWIGDKLKFIAKKLEDSKSDLLVFNYEAFEETNNKTIVTNGINFEEVSNKLLTGEAYLEEIIKTNNLYSWYAWLYVIKRDLIMDFNIRFKPGIKYEDVDLMYEIILKAKKVTVLDETIIRYRLSRQGAITANVKFRTEKDKLDVIKNNIIKVQKLNISEKLKTLLCHNFSCSYYSSLILLNEINDDCEKNKLIDELNDSKWVCKYTISGSQKLVYNLMRIILFLQKKFLQITNIF